MISHKQFDLMKNDAILTQTTGGIIDMNALYTALQNGKFYGVGLDDIDKQFNEMPGGLIQHEKVTCTWHEHIAQSKASTIVPKLVLRI